MMLDPGHVLAMARYNAWQNRMMKQAFEALGDAALRAGRGAHFGSIFATANHVLWGDRTWMHRIAGWEAPGTGIPQSVELTPTPAVWSAERYRADARLLLWAETLHGVDLQGPLRWFSGALGRDVEKPLALCVAHMFNHQTHHRGQIHAMVTGAGGTGWVSDLPFMPDAGPWL